MTNFNEVSLLRRLVTLRVLSADEAGVAVWWWSVERRPDESFPSFLHRKGILATVALESLSHDPLLPSLADEHLRADGWVTDLLARIRQIAGRPSADGSPPSLLTSTPQPFGASSRLPTAKGAKLPQVGGTLGKCLLTEKLGQGGTGLVFRALHQSLNISVAVKVLRPQVLAADPTAYHRFRAEAGMLAQLNHQNLVRIWDFEDDPETPYLILEFVEGLSLAELIQQSGQMRFDKALGIITQVAEGLAFAHRNGIIHRDVKPSNILITKDGIAKIADLGLAVVQSEARKSGGRSDLLGTPAYMAPEQSQSPNSVDHRADLYALGATFYHALTGSPPFEGGTRLQVMYRHISEAPVPPHERVPELSAEASAVVMRLLAKKPEDRPPTYDAVLDDFRRLAAKGRPHPPGPASVHSILTRTPSVTNIPVFAPTRPNLRGEPMPQPGSAADLTPEVRAALREGIELAQRGDRDKARERLRAVTLLDPKNEIGWLWLAGLCESPRQAITCLEKVLAINPANAKASRAIGYYRQSAPAVVPDPVAVVQPAEDVLETPHALATDTDAEVKLPAMELDDFGDDTFPLTAPLFPSKPLILLVDSDLRFAESLETALEAAGYRVTVVGDLASAREMVRAAVPALVVIEPSLPDGDGYSLCESLRREIRTSTVPIVVATSRTGFMDKMRARAAGTGSFLSKPCEPPRVVAVVRQLCPIPDPE